MLTLRLYLNIGILYEDNRDFQKAYDYFVKWHETCQEVRGPVKCTATWLAQLVERRTVVRLSFVVTLKVGVGNAQRY